jgi:EAL domain-containing protein (putative c-di-GMP-specific phosphodiesterase class I)
MGVGDRARPPADIGAIIAARAVSSVYQPIVHLDTLETVGYEALVRGPKGTRWARPDLLFADARRVGRLTELDWICQAVACRGALNARLADGTPLFVNIEPVSMRTECPPDLRDVIARAAARLQIVVEVTERSVADDPAGLLAFVDRLRGEGLRVALDDVGTDAASQAMMPLIRPDVIKLDGSVVHHPETLRSEAIMAAVRAEADRTGAFVVAEGIETFRHLDAARSAGAVLGQGWLFGRAGPLPSDRSPARLALPRATRPAVNGDTPFQVASRFHAATWGGKRTLLALSRALEDRGVHASEPTVLLTTFQQSGNFDEATRRRYACIAAEGMLTAVYALGMTERPAANVRGCPLAAGDPLVGEWTVIVIGGRFAGGLFARQRMGGSGDRAVFDFVTTDDREVVLAASMPLLRRLTPTPLPETRADARPF